MGRAAPSSVDRCRSVRTDGRISQAKDASYEECEPHAVWTAARIGSVCAGSGANHDRCREDYLRATGPHEGRRSRPHRDLAERLLQRQAQLDDGRRRAVEGDREEGEKLLPL